jgi:hypothetical protein
VYASLLQDLRLPNPDDSLQNTALLLQISTWLERHKDATCSVFVMSPDAPDRERSRTPTDELPNFYQGENPSSGPDQGKIYPGDRAIRHETDLTIQIHTLDLLPNPNGVDQLTYRGVKVVATHVPAEMGRDWLVQ